MRIASYSANMARVFFVVLLGLLSATIGHAQRTGEIKNWIAMEKSPISESMRVALELGKEKITNLSNSSLSRVLRHTRKAKPTDMVQVNDYLMSILKEDATIAAISLKHLAAFETFKNTAPSLHRFISSLSDDELFSLLSYFKNNPQEAYEQLVWNRLSPSEKTLFNKDLCNSAFANFLGIMGKPLKLRLPELEFAPNQTH